ncbi:MAG: polysaccharide biosynthesis protein [Firmicutes bacterium]|nr:polysaccharide biosynthesis protein [Bacillota bacterium]
MTSSNMSFVKGAAILALTGVAARVIGAVFRIVLAAILGDEGIGLYQYAYPIYSTLLVISTAGVPVALSKIMAEKIALNDYREALRVFRIAFVILTLSGLVITLVLLLGAEYIALYLIKDVSAYYPLLAISPAIFFVTIMASLRGFFQGQQNMTPTAISQLLEQLVRVGFSIFMIVLLLPVGLEYASAGATSGASAGGLAGLAMLGILYFRSRGKFANKASVVQTSEPESAGMIIKRIFSLAIPITIGGLVIPLINLIDLAVVPRQLQAAGFDIVTARALYGQLTGMAGSVVYFPNVIALALSISLVPAISEAFTLKNHVLIKSRSDIGVKLTVLFSLPSALGLFLLAEPITILLFNNAEAGFALAYLSWSVIPLCLYVTSTGLIQGMGKPIIPAFNMFYGGIVKIVIAWFLTAVPGLNVGGAALASVIGIGVAAALNIYQVHRLTGWRGRLRELILLPLAGTALMSFVVYSAYHGLTYLGTPLLSAGYLNAVAVLVSILTGIVVYGIFLLSSGVVNRDELVMVPYIGHFLVRLAERFRIMRAS